MPTQRWQSSQALTRRGRRHDLRRQTVYLRIAGEHIEDLHALGTQLPSG